MVPYTKSLDNYLDSGLRFWSASRGTVKGVILCLVFSRKWGNGSL